MKFPKERKRWTIKDKENAWLNALACFLVWAIGLICGLVWAYMQTGGV